MSAHSRDRYNRALIRSRALNREVRRLFALSDRWLGQALLNHARKVREEMPELLKNPAQLIYDASFSWHLVPNIAYRLGARNLDPRENMRPEIRGAQGAELRELVGSYLKSLSMRWHSVSTDTNALTSASLLAMDPANGNPVVIALDRIAPAPANPPRSDWLATHLLEISLVRGLEPQAHWAPHMNLPTPPVSRDYPPVSVPGQQHSVLSASLAAQRLSELGVAWSFAGRQQHSRSAGADPFMVREVYFMDRLNREVAVYAGQVLTVHGAPIYWPDDSVSALAVIESLSPTCDQFLLPGLVQD